jgi:hypothetical protein
VIWGAEWSNVELWRLVPVRIENDRREMTSEVCIAGGDLRWCSIGSVVSTAMSYKSAMLTFEEHDMEVAIPFDKIL